MDLEEFKQSKIKGREKLLNKILEIFRRLNPLAIYQFGSGAKSYKDEFSDIDLWFVFKDNEVEKIVKNQAQIFKSIAPNLLKHSSKSWSPSGGSATLIIHQTEFGLFQVDYYISKLSETIIKEDAKLLYGTDLLPRGEWRLDKETKESVTLKKDITLLIILAFISIKGIIRKWDKSEHKDNIKMIYKRIDGRGKVLPLLPRKLSFKFVYKLLDNLYPLANKGQKKAIIQIRNYALQAESLYK